MPWKGIEEHKLDISGMQFKCIDASGQPYKKAKWFQCFENVPAILFLVSSRTFDQVLEGDRVINQLVESCDLFGTIVNNQFFANSSIFLLFTETDLLEEKVQHISIKDFFPSFQGNPHKLEDVQEFIFQMFVNCVQDKSRVLYHHRITTTDTEHLRYVFHSVKDTLLQYSLKQLLQ